MQYNWRCLSALLCYSVVVVVLVKRFQEQLRIDFERIWRRATTAPPTRREDRTILKGAASSARQWNEMERNAVEICAKFFPWIYFADEFAINLYRFCSAPATLSLLTAVWPRIGTSEDNETFAGNLHSYSSTTVSVPSNDFATITHSYTVRPSFLPSPNSLHKQNSSKEGNLHAVFEGALEWLIPVMKQ